MGMRHRRPEGGRGKSRNGVRGMQENHDGRGRSLLWALGLAAALLLGGPAEASDCNGNGIDDAADLAPGASRDCNGNGVPDECDLASTLAFEAAPEMQAGDHPRELAAGDLDGDGRVDLVMLDSTPDLLFLRNEGG